MKKLLALLVSVLLLSTVAMAAVVEFEEDYVKGKDLVLASFHGVKPFVADSENPVPLEDACFWLAENVDKLNLKYVSFIGEMSSQTNFPYGSLPTNTEVYEANRTDKEWIKDFQLLKNTAYIVSEVGVPYGVTIGQPDYWCSGVERDNHMQTTFEITDFVGEADVKYEFYDNNNYAFYFTHGKTMYIVYQLEIFPRAAILNWFRTMQATHSDKRAIIYTASFTDKSGEMYTQHDWADPDWKTKYTTFNSKCRTNLLNRDRPHDGINLWNNAIAQYDNILCVVSANDTVGKDIVVSTFKNNNGYPVTAVLANLDGGYSTIGEAYPVLLKISEDNKTLDVRYAVPYYNKVGGYVKESHQVIELDKVLKLPEPEPSTLLPKVSAQANGENKSYIKGYENNLFKPNNNMTKAEACTIFARLLANTNDIPDGYTTRFTDVKPGDWFYNAIAYLDTLGFFYTTEGTKYNPNAKITRAEFVELAYFASDLETSEVIYFKDVEEDSKYYTAITAASAAGLVKGYGDSTFKPDATITRAEVVTVINRLLTLIADEKRVSKNHLDKVFSDIEGHWAEYQILMASNDNVRGDYFYNIDKNTLKEDSSTIFFENQHVKVTINKKGATVKELINKVTGENVLAPTVTPWFSYLLNKSGIPIQPKTAEIEDGRLKVTYKNDFVAYLNIEVKENYFSVTLDTNIPTSIRGIVLCELTTNAPWELDNPDAFGLSAIPMTTTVEILHYPGGISKIAKGSTYSFLGVNTLGSKVGVAFSRMTEHREHLKDIADDINPEEGITSTHGGAYALDNPDIFGDYVIIQNNFTMATAEETAELCKKYSVEQFDIHKGGKTFIQGDFNFVCARSSTETQLNKHINGEVFKKRIGHHFIDRGIQLSLHTYSSVINAEAFTLLSVPENQQDIIKTSYNWTLRGEITKSRTNIKTYEDASNFVFGTNGNIPYGGNPGSKYILIDEEIILVQQGTSAGFLNVQRGQCGTKATVHQDGAKIYQLQGWYNGFQPKPLSDLFYKVAELTADAYNKGGFEMIYLDGLESFARDYFTTSSERYYVFAEFVRAVVANCEKDPIIEYSAMYPVLWSARGRGGAIDYARRAYKNQKTLHLDSQKNYLNYFYTATAGWFSYCPDANERYKDTAVRSVYRDDLDHMGSLCLAYNFGTVSDGFSVAEFTEKTRRADNFMYYGLYTRLREGNYFAPEVKKQILEGKYEFKVFKQTDGTWAFKEMKYAKTKIFDISTPALSSGTVNNPFEAQKPFIRIEQRYSTEGKVDDAALVFAFDESKSASSYVGTHTINRNISGKQALKLRVHGNGSSTDAILISLATPTTVLESGRYDYFIPLNFTGWKEIILIEANNEDYDGYTFSDIAYGGTAHNRSYRGKMSYDNVATIQVSLCGSCSGANLGTLYAYTPSDAPVKNPSITVGDNVITFDAELHASDFIEYYPDENKAYLNYYTQIFKDDGTWLDDEAHVKEISFSGSVEVPKGDFTFKYNAEALTSVTPRAQVVFGFAGKVIANPEGWDAPEIDLPKDIEKVTLY